MFWCTLDSIHWTECMCVCVCVAEPVKCVLVPLCLLLASFLEPVGLPSVLSVSSAQVLTPHQHRVQSLLDHRSDLTQKVHVPLVQPSSKQELLWDTLGVACLISSQLLLVWNVVVTWRLFPVKEPTLRSPITLLVSQYNKLSRMYERTYLPHG